MVTATSRLLRTPLHYGRPLFANRSSSQRHLSFSRNSLTSRFVWDIQPVACIHNHRSFSTQNAPSRNLSKTEVPPYVPPVGPINSPPVLPTTHTIISEEDKTPYASQPEYVEKWSRKNFYRLGYVLIGSVGAATASFGLPGLLLAGIPVSAYWAIGLRDIKQVRRSILRNFPLIGNLRYMLESVRPEIRQYFIEGDHDDVPFSREKRSINYKRSKLLDDTLPFGTRQDVYGNGYEWANHSLFPTHPKVENSRVLFGGPACTKPYSCALLNVSGMSFGAISENAVLALNGGAKMGNFYQSTGEGGVSPFHLRPGGDIVWNVGTGYFGCRDANGNFSREVFQRTAILPQVKMIELKISQGAKPAHGGILPKAKVNDAIALTRGVPKNVDCISPPAHSAFNGPTGMGPFLAELRELSGGKPVGFKLCLGQPDEWFLLLRALLHSNNPAHLPDFISVDGGEGGTGAAPLEFSNHMGTPLVEGLSLVHRSLIGAGIRRHVKIVCSGKIMSGFQIIRNVALGADVCASARAMMFALGCIQALKCNTNRCPTGIATQDRELMEGLHVPTKSVRVANYQRKTVEAAMELLGAMGLDKPEQLEPRHIMVRVAGEARSYAQMFPPVAHAAFLRNEGPADLQKYWDDAGKWLNNYSQGCDINWEAKRHTRWE